MKYKPNNEVMRGKYLGEVDINNIDKFITDHAINKGKFIDIYLGDYFTIKYKRKKEKIRIFGLDCMNNVGYHHIICVPDNGLEIDVINNFSTKSSKNGSALSGYAGSDVHNVTIDKINTNLKEVFGDHLLTSKEHLGDGSKNGGYYNCKAVLMSLKEVFGDGKYLNNVIEEQKRLPLFSILENFNIEGFKWFWLRDMDLFANYYFSDCIESGMIRYNANIGWYVCDVRPRFILG
jgi:hypothetical protein